VPQAPIEIAEIKQILLRHNDVRVMVDEVLMLEQLPPRRSRESSEDRIEAEAAEYQKGSIRHLSIGEWAVTWQTSLTWGTKRWTAVKVRQARINEYISRCYEKLLQKYNACQQSTGITQIDLVSRIGTLR